MQANNLTQILSPEILSLIRIKYPSTVAQELISIPSITVKDIGDPTRGYENVFNVSYWSMKYEDKQYMTWEDEGGLCQ